jgi:hypothetical protein
MKTRILTVFATVALMLGLAYAVTAPAASKAAAVPSAAAAEPHPEIHDALNALRRAKDHMEHAAHDFGGHRVEALRATQEAINQLEICLKYDR